MISTANASQDYQIGAAVHCLDGRCGKLTRVVIDPATNEITDLIVEKGALMRSDRVVPIAAITRVSREGIWLDVKSDKVETYAKYTEREFVVPVEDWGHERHDAYHTSIWMMPYGQAFIDQAVPMRAQHVTEGIASTLEAIGRGTAVMGAEGQLGTVNHVLANRESEEITHLIVRRGGLLPDYCIMAIDQVTEIDDDGIHTTLTDEEFGALPEYKSRSRARLAP